MGNSAHSSVTKSDYARSLTTEVTEVTEESAPRRLPL
jgi:hypothetical protein